MPKSTLQTLRAEYAWMDLSQESVKWVDFFFVFLFLKVGKIVSIFRFMINNKQQYFRRPSSFSALALSIHNKHSALHAMSTIL